MNQLVTLNFKMMKNTRKLFLSMSVAALVLTGCSDDDNNNGTPPLPPIGGYNN